MGAAGPVDDDLGLVARFLARRDVGDVEAVGHADVLVLCGSAVLPSLDVAARAVHAGVVPRVLVTGGVGHSTGDLHEAVRRRPDLHEVRTRGRSEAAVIGEVLRRHHAVPSQAVLLEEDATHCGENAELSLRLLAASAPDARSVLLVQDPTMQRRTHASFERHARSILPVAVTSFAPFVPRVGEVAVGDPTGTPVWSRDRFVALVLGEVRRLRDDADGYGPRGAGHIDHVDVPADVEAAARRLERAFPGAARPPT